MVQPITRRDLLSTLDGRSFVASPLLPGLFGAVIVVGPVHHYLGLSVHYAGCKEVWAPQVAGLHNGLAGYAPLIVVLNLRLSLH